MKKDQDKNTTEEEGIPNFNTLVGPSVGTLTFILISLNAGPGVEISSLTVYRVR